jgi:hypothetical protein
MLFCSAMDFSRARMDFSLPTNRGSTMNGKTMMSLNGRSGNTIFSEPIY